KAPRSPCQCERSLCAEAALSAPERAPSLRPCRSAEWRARAKKRRPADAGWHEGPERPDCSRPPPVRLLRRAKVGCLLLRLGEMPPTSTQTDENIPDEETNDETHHRQQ